MFFPIALIAGFAPVISALSGPWNKNDQFGAVLCETSSGSPFTSDCENAARALATRGGVIPRGTDGGCYTAEVFHSCGIALCGGNPAHTIDAGEVAFWGRTINAQCAQDVGANNFPVSGGQVGVRNDLVGDLQVQLWYIAGAKRDEPEGDSEQIAGTDLSSRAHGQSYNIGNTLFELISVNEAGDEECILFDDEEEEILNSIQTLTTNPNPGQRVVRGGTEPDVIQVDATVAMMTGANGGYISDISPDEWRQITEGMLEFRQQTGNRATFSVRLHSIGNPNPLGFLNIARVFY
ncbi:hypothetical protein FQN54_002770 [Arachnomyces sp. PD_36]|nr:hypothetical protein FQN54_002770 [Arachnomyces sp. PD_36]